MLTVNPRSASSFPEATVDKCLVVKKDDDSLQRKDGLASCKLGQPWQADRITVICLHLGRAILDMVTNQAQGRPFADPVAIPTLVLVYRAHNSAREARTRLVQLSVSQVPMKSDPELESPGPKQHDELQRVEI